MDYLFLFVFLALVAEILGTIGGFGSSIFFVPIASFFLDFQSVLGITAVFHVTSNITKIAMFRKGYDKSLVIYLGIPAVVFVLIGAYLSKFFVLSGLEVILAIFLIILSLTFLLFKSFNLKASKKNSIIGGILSGGLAGFIGTGGAVRGMTLASFKLKPEIFIATSAIIDLGVDSGRTVVYWFNGFIQSEHLYLIPFLIAASIIGTYIGKRLLANISDEKFRVIVLILILITGITSVIKFLTY